MGCKPAKDSLAPPNKEGKATRGAPAVDRSRSATLWGAWGHIAPCELVCQLHWLGQKLSISCPERAFSWDLRIATFIR